MLDSYTQLPQRDRRTQEFFRSLLGCGKMSEPNRVCRTSCGDEQLGRGHIGNSFEEGHSESSVTLSSEVLTRDSTFIEAQIVMTLG